MFRKASFTLSHALSETVRNFFLTVCCSDCSDYADCIAVFPKNFIIIGKNDQLLLHNCVLSSMIHVASVELLATLLVEILMKNHA